MTGILRRWSMPAALLALCLLSFGILIPRLGFYWDDWPVILTGRLLGANGFWQFYQYDRPISAWTYILTFPILGSQPIFWHIFTLLLRWATTLAMWWTLTRLWPERRSELNWMALLFCIYPVFTQQSISVAYSQHWICYLFYFLSMGGMVQAYRWRESRPGAAAALTIIALAASLIQLLTMEYFAGLDLLRPFLLWVLVSEQPAPTRKKLVTVLRRWAPYLVVLVGFVIWRLLFLQFPGEEANPPVLLEELLVSPVSAGLRFLQIAIQDTLHLLVMVWSNILTPAKIELTDRFSIFSWFWTVLVAALAILFLFRNADEAAGKAAAATPPGRWNREALTLGLVALALGMLPVWFTDRQIIVGMYSSRFGLPAMLGASIILVALMNQWVAHHWQRIVLVGILVGLAAGQHLRTANDYRWSWISQTRFYWNLAWRAPGIQPGTALLSDGEIFGFVGLYSTAAGTNLLYPASEPSSRLPYWFYSLGREFAYNMPELLGGTALKRNFRNYSFEGNTKDALVVFYQPADKDCLEILTAKDANAPDLPDITRQALENSDLSRILPEARTSPPPGEIFGPEPEHGWCYFYEKAALAQQNGDWQQVTTLADQARAQGYSLQRSDSNTPLEWIPFIEGYAQAGRWSDAEALSLSAYEKDRRMDARLCDLWRGLLTSTSQSDTRDTIALAVRSQLGCPE